MAGKIAAQVKRNRLRMEKIRGKWLWVHPTIDNSPISKAEIARFAEIARTLQLKTR